MVSDSSYGKVSLAEKQQDVYRLKLYTRSLLFLGRASGASYGKVSYCFDLWLAGKRQAILRLKLRIGSSLFPGWTSGAFYGKASYRFKLWLAKNGIGYPKHRITIQPDAMNRRARPNRTE
jgi:hypothetical protein